MGSRVSPDEANYALKHEPASPAHGRAFEATSPHRGHPYSRRPSLPSLMGEHVPRIHLPPPNINAHSNSTTPRGKPHDQHVNIPGISSLVLGSPGRRTETERERDRYWDDRQQRPEALASIRPHIGRSVSGDSARAGRPSLPPLHSLGVSEPSTHTPTSTSASTPQSIPLPNRHRTNPPSPPYPYSRPPSPPAVMPSQGSYSQRFGRHLPHDREGRHAYPQSRDVSPPLRAMHPYDLPQHHRPPPDAYQMAYRHNDPHRHPQMPIDPYTGRPIHHPGSGSSVRRQDDVKTSAQAAPPGQSRRLAHLMSEQKRRESINSGFQALRKVVPSSSPTDSKAVILRKAAAHIAHLDAIIRNGSHSAISPDEDEIMLSDDVPGDEEDEGSELSDRDHLGLKSERATSRDGWDKNHSRSC